MHGLPPVIQIARRWIEHSSRCLALVAHRAQRDCVRCLVVDMVTPAPAGRSTESAKSLDELCLDLKLQANVGPLPPAHTTGRAPLGARSCDFAHLARARAPPQSEGGDPAGYRCYLRHQAVVPRRGERRGCRWARVHYRMPRCRHRLRVLTRPPAPAAQYRASAPLRDAPVQRSRRAVTLFRRACRYWVCWRGVGSVP
jgi:hypothetical protein